MAFNINGEYIAPNSTTLNLYVWNSLSGSSGAVNHRNLVQSLSSSCSQTWRNAFSISVQIPTGWHRNRKMMQQRSFSCGFPVSKQSFGFLIGGSCSRRRYELEWFGSLCGQHDALVVSAGGSTHSMNPRHSCSDRISWYLESREGERLRANALVRRAHVKKLGRKGRVVILPWETRRSTLFIM